MKLSVAYSPVYLHQVNPPQHHPHKHELIIDSVSIEDFANYTCLATNNMGKSEGAVELRGQFLYYYTDTILFYVV